jgi:cell wall-associated NlpC family hydrolase
MKHTNTDTKKLSHRWFSMLAALLTLLLVAGCASKPKTARIIPETHATDGLLDFALSLQGTPYRWGEESPEEGFDCSGFVWYVYRQYGYSIPRTAAQIAYDLPEVATEDRKPGDILVFNYGDQPFAHVGLYLGHDSFIHASSGKAASVTVSNLDTPYWWGRFAGVRRPVH